MKRILSLAIIITVLLPQAGVCGDVADKDNAWSIRTGLRVFPTDTTDEAANKYNSSDLDSAFYELAYERRPADWLGLEVAAGYADGQAGYTDGLLPGDRYEYRIEQGYLAATLKAYWRPCPYFAAYAGAGGNAYRTRIEFDYAHPLLTYSDSETETSYGWQGCGGVEFLVYRDPASAGEFDWPMSLIIEYKISEEDEDVAGEYISAGLKWHF